MKANSEKPSAAGQPATSDSEETAGKAQKPTVSGDHPIELRPGPETLVRRTAKVFRSSEGMQILVGKSSKDNDTLTLKVARSEDFWLHVAGYGGSHVVLRNPEKLPAAPKQSLLEAAQLAAYFSQARNAPKVEVHYTQKKFVSKPKGAKPGLVRLKEYKSISARPQLLKENKQMSQIDANIKNTSFIRLLSSKWLVRRSNLKPYPKRLSQGSAPHDRRRCWHPFQICIVHQSRYNRRSFWQS